MVRILSKGFETVGLYKIMPGEWLIKVSSFRRDR